MAEASRDQHQRSLLERIFWLQAGELRQILPYFGLYLILFMGLTLSDALSLALFVQRIGAARLPACYALTAVLNLLAMVAYLWGIRRFGSNRIFQGILTGSAALSLFVWGQDRLFSQGSGWYALLFVGREISSTLVLMHFGTYLLDFFGRDQLRRVLPIIYAGGRVGGIAGGLALQTLTEFIDPIDLILLFVALFVAGAVALELFQPKHKAVRVVTSEGASNGSEVPLAPDSTTENTLEREASESLSGFLRFVWRFPLMYWTTVTSVLFVVCRWILNYQYSHMFEQQFSNAAEMARFLGQYTQFALLISLLFQLLVVNRLVTWIGLKGSHLLYGTMVLGAFSVNLIWWTLPAAVFSRFVETELRFGLRNPVAQMILNQFSSPVRIQARAWSLGFLVPCSTVVTALLLSQVSTFVGPSGVAWMGAMTSLGYVITSFGLYSSFSESTSRGP